MPTASKRTSGKACDQGSCDSAPANPQENINRLKAALSESMGSTDDLLSTETTKLQSRQTSRRVQKSSTLEASSDPSEPADILIHVTTQRSAPLSEGKSRSTTGIPSAEKSHAKKAKEEAELAVEDGKEKLVEAKDAAVKKGQEVAEDLECAYEGAKEKAQEVGQDIKEKATELAQDAKDTASNAAEATKDAANNLVEKAKDAAANVSETAQNLYEGAVEKAQEIGAQLKDGALAAKEVVEEKGSQAIEKVQELGAQAKDSAIAATEVAKEKGSQAIEKVQELGAQAKESALHAVENVKETGAHAIEVAQEKKEEAAEYVAETAESFRRKGTEIAENFHETVEQAQEAVADRQQEIKESIEQSSVLQAIAHTVMEGVTLVAGTASLAIDKVKDTFSSSPAKESPGSKDAAEDLDMDLICDESDLECKKKLQLGEKAEVEVKVTKKPVGVFERQIDEAQLKIKRS
eukprot:TRINITY_DN3910_c0_g1_i4.p1 TRINITY_DN3910_c0_g1~~TRINITY_DN3910_c0_g1_i4.p1  ORF type:complete len:464 (-),score=144.60 TRINITY_DN3910_c0_g1_i4:1752-3143(-)